jgi:hypothetical protein
VGVAGGEGLDLVAGDLRRFTVASAGDVTVIDGTALAFRRQDAATRGPLDERFQSDRHLDTWWSLVLRDEGEGSTPRRAVAIDLPLTRPSAGAGSTPDRSGAERDGPDRAFRRDFYRIVERFGSRRDLFMDRHER